jgi:hypothetical protein
MSQFPGSYDIVYQSDFYIRHLPGKQAVSFILGNDTRYGNSGNIGSSQTERCAPRCEVTFVPQQKLLWDSGIVRVCFHAERQ